MMIMLKLHYLYRAIITHGVNNFATLSLFQKIYYPHLEYDVIDNFFESYPPLFSAEINKIHYSQSTYYLCVMNIISLF